MAAIDLLVPIFTSALGSGGLVSFVFSRKLQKARTESVIVEASGKFVRDVSEQMTRMDRRMQELEKIERECQRKLRALQERIAGLEQEK